MLEIVEVDHDSAPYRAIVNLRRRILRAPLGLDFTREQLHAERTDIHIGCYLAGALVGCVALTPSASSEGASLKLRQMVVDPDHRGRDIGREILGFAEAWALARGYIEIALNAREAATGFYERAGYAAQGERFIEVTIPHRKMIKRLSVARAP